MYLWVASIMENEIINRVAESGLITIDLASYYPKEETGVFDIKDYLFRGLILKEKDYRTALQSVDWDVYRNKLVGITCSADAIVPMWAYMLAATYLQPVAAQVIFSEAQNVSTAVLLQHIQQIDAAKYADKRVVIKGCGDIQIPEAAYVAITAKLRPYAKSIMYGEPCSTVPLFKRK